MVIKPNSNYLHAHHKFHCKMFIKQVVLFPAKMEDILYCEAMNENKRLNKKKFSWKRCHSVGEPLNC